MTFDFRKAVLGRAYIAYSTGKPFTQNARDVHGGYFWGQFSQQLMYRLAFVGFQEFLDSLGSTNKQTALDELSKLMEEKQIQTILSPERYLVDVMGEDRKQVRAQILNKGIS